MNAAAAAAADLAPSSGAGSAPSSAVVPATSPFCSVLESDRGPRWRRATRMQDAASPITALGRSNLPYTPQPNTFNETQQNLKRGWGPGGAGDGDEVSSTKCTCELRSVSEVCRVRRMFPRHLRGLATSTHAQRHLGLGRLAKCTKLVHGYIPPARMQYSARRANTRRDKSSWADCPRTLPKSPMLMFLEHQSIVSTYLSGFTACPSLLAASSTIAISSNAPLMQSASTPYRVARTLLQLPLPPPPPP